jgi:hypothetical protein
LVIAFMPIAAPAPHIRTAYLHVQDGGHTEAVPSVTDDTRNSAAAGAPHPASMPSQDCSR